MEDKEIIELFCMRKESAIEMVELCYGRRMYRVSYNITKVREDAEECCNEALLILWNNIPKVKPEYLWPYIRTIVCRISMDRMDYNYAGKRNINCRVSFDDKKCSDFVNMDYQIEKIALMHAFENFRCELTEEKYNVFIERYEMGFMIEEIAKNRNISKSKVKMMLLRMRRELELYLKEENIFF